MATPSFAVGVVVFVQRDDSDEMKILIDCVDTPPSAATDTKTCGAQTSESSWLLRICVGVLSNRLDQRAYFRYDIVALNKVKDLALYFAMKANAERPAALRGCSAPAGWLLRVR